MNVRKETCSPQVNVELAIQLSCCSTVYVYFEPFLLFLLMLAEFWGKLFLSCHTAHTSLIGEMHYIISTVFFPLKQEITGKVEWRPSKSWLPKRASALLILTRSIAMLGRKALIACSASCEKDYPRLEWWFASVRAWRWGGSSLLWDVWECLGSSC